jgi:hypothetical protein
MKEERERFNKAKYSIPGVSKVRPAGRIRPFNVSNPAR